MKATLIVECFKCGMWESQPSDQQRHHIQSFEHMENLENGNGVYKCECGELVTSTIESPEPDPEEKYWQGVATYNERFSYDDDDGFEDDY